MNDHNLRDLRSAGVGISIDDFGTGYSSLAQLHRLPVTEVKIDRSFTSRIAEGGSSGFIAGIVGLGQGMGLRVVAEGVETPEHETHCVPWGANVPRGSCSANPWMHRSSKNNSEQAGANDDACGWERRVPLSPAASVKLGTIGTAGQRFSRAPLGPNPESAPSTRTIQHTNASGHRAACS